MSDWRERRDALVAEYLRKADRDAGAAYAAIDAAIAEMPVPVAADVLLSYMEARAILWEMKLPLQGFPS